MLFYVSEYASAFVTVSFCIGSDYLLSCFAV